jgi:carbonic anhydrase
MSNNLNLCPNNNAPICIVANTATECSKACDFKYNYKINEVLLVNNVEDHIIISNIINIDNNNSPVIYKSTNFNVSNIYIYQNSLHAYNTISNKADAELIIEHKSSDYLQTLLVCIPIKATGTTNPNPFLKAVIGSYENNDSQPPNKINVNFNELNNVILKKPYYVYNANLPYSPCNGDFSVYYLSYNLSDGFLEITTDLYNTLTQVIQQHNYVVSNVGPSDQLSYNKNGPTLNTQSSDEFYMDCQPVNDGIVEEEHYVKLKSNSNSNLINIQKEENMFLTIFIGLIIGLCCIILIIGLYKLFEYILKSSVDLWKKDVF